MKKNIFQPLAPSDKAASSSSLPISCIKGISCRATNGNVIKSVANTIPGTAKIIFISFTISQCPSQPCAPNINTKIKPEITGDTEKGKSINVIKKSFPRKSKRVIAHAAATPKMVFSGTVINAVNNVKRIAASISC